MPTAAGSCSFGLTHSFEIAKKHCMKIQGGTRGAIIFHDDDEKGRRRDVRKQIGRERALKFDGDSLKERFRRETDVPT